MSSSPNGIEQTTDNETFRSKVVIKKPTNFFNDTPENFKGKQGNSAGQKYSESKKRI